MTRGEMSADGGSGRGFAARFRALGASGRRSMATLRLRLAGPAASADAFGVDALSADALEADASPPHGIASAAELADSRRRPAGTAVLEAVGVPGLLARVAAWAVCLLLVAAVAYLAFKVAIALRLLVLPMIAALLITALLEPLTRWLKRKNVPPLAATWITVLAAILVLGGVVFAIIARVQADYPRLAAEAQSTVRQVEAYLAGPPFRLNKKRLAELSGKLLQYLGQHKTLVIGTVLTGGRYFIEGLTGIVLTIFITFFLLKDGGWLWEKRLIAGLGERARGRAMRAGAEAWRVLGGYIRGTTIVAAIHAGVIGVALWLIGVPLVAPLMILVFLASYVPLVGILVVGALAIMVTLATKGLVGALILLIVFLAENQLESHLLQPLVVGRVVKLHPLTIVIVLAVGGIVAGVPGAIVAVPTTAVLTHSWPYLVTDGEPRSLEPRRRARS
jgi:predicted PurR-regulated permease PerM